MRKHNNSSLINKIMFCVKVGCFAVGIIIFAASNGILIFLSNRQMVDNSVGFNKQIINQIDTLFSNMGNYSTQISLNIDLESMIKNYKGYSADNLLSEEKLAQIELKLKTLATRNENVIGLDLVTSDGQRFCSELNENESSLFNAAWFKRYKEKLYPSYFSAPFVIQNKTLGNNTVIAFCSPYKSIGGIQGDLITIMLFRPIQKLMDEVQKNTGTYLLLGADNEILYAPSSKFRQIAIKNVVSEFNKIQPGDEFYKRVGVNYNFVSLSQTGDWKLITKKSVISMFVPMWQYFLLIPIVVFLFCILVVAMVLPRLKKMISPLILISNQLQEKKADNFDKIKYEKTGDEIEELGMSLNHMIEKLHQYFNFKISHEKEKNKMKYSLLMSQIDPHFIYNTLNTINYLARKKKYEDIVEVNKALISILRDRLRLTDVNIYETIENAIAVVNDYAVIQHYRFGDNFSLNISVDKNINSLIIPKNIIQPLVENALFHGIFARDNQSEKGTVDISIRSESTQIIIRVSDNGAGMDESILNTLNDGCNIPEEEMHGRHIGIRNIQKRLQFMYGKKDCIRIDSHLNVGTSVTIVIPQDTSRNQIE